MAKVYRFYKAKLPTVVCNPDGSGTVVAEFVDAQFFTEDREIAKILARKGYPQIPLSASGPPELPPDVFQHGKMKDVKPAKTEAQALYEQMRTKAALKATMDALDDDEPLEDLLADDEIPLEEKKETGGKRKVTRRNK